MAWLMEWIGQRRLKQLLSQVSSRNVLLREPALKRLTAMGAAVVPTLVEELRRAEAQRRLWAAVILGRIGHVNGIAPLIDRLGDQEEGVRSAASRALKEIGRPAVPALLQCLAGADELRRAGAATTLGEIGDHRAVQPLVARLADKDLVVRTEAAEALGNLGDAAAVPPLIKLLEDESPTLCQTALCALDRLGTPEALEALRHWHEDRR